MTTATTPTERLLSLGLELPKVPAPAGTYVHATRAGEILYLAGHVPIRADGSVIFGRLGDDLDVDAGYEAARVAALGVLSTIVHELGSLDQVARFLRVYVVNATQEFKQHTQVINGASDLFVAVFGDAGTHARLAVGWRRCRITLRWRLRRRFTFR